MSTPSAGHELSPQTTIPDLLARHPEARAVLDRYGLRGCGGRSGPRESLAFFARMHGVATDVLLDELRAAIGSRPPAQVAEASVADIIYRRYFTAGIVVVLTVGAAWGAWILWKIGFAHSFTGVSIHEINAHGHAQIFGWVGLFIMGFAYQAFPRFWRTTLVAPRLAAAAFVAMVVGIATRTLGIAMHDQPWAAWAALFGGTLEVAAIATFAGQIVATWRRGAASFEPYLAFVFAALAFFVLQAPLSVWHSWTTITAPSKGEMLFYVQAYQPMLRGLQVHGLALLMVLGVSQRLLPAAFGLPWIAARRAWVCFALLIVAVVGEAICFFGHGQTGNHIWAAAVMLPWVLLASGSLGLAWPWRLWRPMPEASRHDRSGKFIRAAYGWLAVSMAMLLLFPVYQAAVELAFSHAYYGAIRHAITVGFVSLMIMGVAAKVVPTLNGIDPRTLNSLWGPFLLVNAGCALRVSLQTLTDWHPAFFGVVGVSGLLELAGLTWWGLHLVAVMRRGKREAAEADAPHRPPSAPPTEVLPEHAVADVLAWFPDTLQAFDRFGFTPLRNPVLRRTIAKRISVRDAARLRGVNETELLAALNARVAAAE